MTTLLNSSTATGATATEGDVKTFLTNLRTFIADLLGADSSNKSAVHMLLGSILNASISKSSAYTVVAADKGKVIVCSGSTGFNLTLTAAATLGDGFVFAVVNNATVNITIDPNLSELINGAASYVVHPTETVIVFCDGTKFVLFGKAPANLVSTFNGLTGDITAAQAAAAVNSANGGVPVKQDNGASAIGSICLGGGQDGFGVWVGVNAGSTTSVFYAAILSASSTWSSPSVAAQSGIWRNIGMSTGPSKPIGLFQRVS